MSFFAGHINSFLNRNWPLSSLWPNTQTALSSTSAVVNLACIAINSSLQETLGINFPIRTVNFLYSLYLKKYYKAVLEIPAFAVLLLPNGRLISIIIDIASEMLNFDKQTSSTFRLSCLLNPKVRENAFKILNISKDKENDLEFIESQHQLITSDLEKRKSQLSAELAKQMQLLIDDANEALKTLKRANK